jgi:hypothetical protein
MLYLALDVASGHGDHGLSPLAWGAIIAFCAVFLVIRIVAWTRGRRIRNWGADKYR